MMRNKPNLSHGKATGKWAVRKELWCVQPARRAGKTKPIPGEPGGWGPVEYAKQSQTWAGWDIWETARQEGPMAQNEPNSRQARYPTIPLFHHSGVPTRCEMCKTNPIRAGPGCRWRRLCETNPIRRQRPGRFRRNKANRRGLGGRPVSRVRQHAPGAQGAGGRWDCGCVAQPRG